jgi:hypothetical protein
MLHHGFMRFTVFYHLSHLTVVSYLVSLLLSQIQMARQKIETAWHENMLPVIHSVLN